MPGSRRRRSRRHERGGGGLGLFFTLLVLVGLIAAAFVYGRPYLFPDDWDEATKPYADAVEVVRGEAIVEPFSVVAEEPFVFDQGFDTDYFGAWVDQLPMWRAFGLADGGANAATLTNLVTVRPVAYYSRTDRQVHADAARQTEQLDPATMVAAAEAVLDQDYRWTMLLDGATIERQAIVRALVDAEARHIQESSTIVGAPPAAADQLAQLPGVLDHQLIAPSVYAEIVGPPLTSDEARMTALESFASELPGSAPLPLGTPAVLAEGEATAGTALPMDRSFWYLVFASRLDAPSAHDLSESLTAASLTPIRTPDLTTCWAAVFDAETPEAAFIAATALNSWVEAAPAESTASMTVVAETTVQLRTCDPGVAAATTMPSAARSLIGHRAAELAVIAGVTARGGGAVEVEAGLALLTQSSIGDDMAALAVNAAPETIASEATAKVVPIVDTSTAGLPVDPVTGAGVDGSVPADPPADATPATTPVDVGG